MQPHHVRRMVRRDPAVRRFRRLVPLLLAPLLLAWVPAPTVRDAGPVIDLSEAIASTAARHGQRPGQGRLLLTSVREGRDPLWRWAIRSLLEPTWDPSRNRAAGGLNTLAEMQSAKVYAWEVAVTLALRPTALDSLPAFAARADLGPMPTVDTGRMTGPSGGLMLALAFTDALNPGDLTSGRKVAGTGTIDQDGTIGPIGYVSYKVQGAAAAGANVFFVPSGDFAIALRLAPPGLEVVPVTTFTEAVTWLCDHESANRSSTVCRKLGELPAGVDQEGR